MFCMSSLTATDQKALIPGPMINLEVPIAFDPRVHAPCGLEGQKVKFYNNFKKIMPNL